ncbi:MAG: Na(+)-translocating NADH-quinone reductase subunit A [Sphingomonadales bacterium]|nr:Na(+)-translocating NADH-quinone reductase subunit A [Sphingomonadales bacterium]
MAQTISLRRGYDIKLVGTPKTQTIHSLSFNHCAVRPTVFRYQKLRLLVEEGSTVMAGSPLLEDKSYPGLFICSPVSGKVQSILRGSKRVLEAIVLEQEAEIRYLDFGSAKPEDLNADAIRAKMMNAGVWSLVRQRPYNHMARPDAQPRCIVISAFNTVPMGADRDFQVDQDPAAFAEGLKALQKLCPGKVYLNVHQRNTRSKAFTGAQGVQMHRFDGPHPSGNVGIQMHHIAPITKGDCVWTLSPSDVIILGRLFLTGYYDARRWVAVGGSSLQKPGYVQAILGASVSEIVKAAGLQVGEHRMISGDVLSGEQVAADGYLGYYHDQLSVIPEGRDLEFLGWLLPSYPRPDISKSFLSGWISNRTYKVNTNTHGEERAFVMTGQYEKVLPMDLLLTYLLKAIHYQDVEEMEQLGLYELDEEDVALCEFVCTSKIPVQEMIRKGLDIMIAEEE